MLADWGIYHLNAGHGTKRAKNPGFENRANELLFVFPKGDKLYFIDILGHKSWTNYSLIATLDNNWPSSIDHCRLIGCIGLEYEPKEEELLRLRKNHINSPFRIGNSFFIGGDGSSTKAVQMADDISDALDHYSKILNNEENQIRKQIENKIGHQLIIDNLVLTLHQFDPKTVKGKILEKNCNIVLNFSLD